MAKPGEPKEKPLNELLSHDIVDIYVGPENTHWALHEKLLCHRSPFFRNVFWTNTPTNKGNRQNQTFGLPDDDDVPFRHFVGWLYSDHVPPPREEKDLTTLIDLYLMGEKWSIPRLTLSVLETIRIFYHDTASWPSLRRVQYVYANSDPDSPLRQLLVSCVARMLVLSPPDGERMPEHWEKALRRNGQLAVDIILCVQKWHFEPESVPDAREESVIPLFEGEEESGRGGGERVVKSEEEEDADQTMVNGYHNGGSSDVNGEMPEDGQDAGVGDTAQQYIKQEPEDDDS
ncbi:hypothetical protein KC331_g8240 [Hortaea werneckii]|uniref:BTB domain-containing protein n=1 Tax=Hortaea werneckii TaxID=91943 RepID=A0A3M7BRL1_HORWE|nr:hypothetical protein KC331_g8240 [Hortaea werneckii]KAI7713317.1 hypothetical protein KC353_g7657 [Hortaea werneckii]RMY42475.1 hypothetical protein D0865_11944 [Hortaea werneckii]